MTAGINTSNTNLTFKGKPLTVRGNVQRVGAPLPKFHLTANDMSDVTNESFAGKILIVSSVPSLDTPVCSIETKRFNDEAAKLSPDVAILTVSLDLPFAQKRWCGAEGVTNLVTASDYKYRSFGDAFGVYLEELGLLARAVFVADRNGKLMHVEYVPEIASEPNYEAALSAARTLSR